MLVKLSEENLSSLLFDWGGYHLFGGDGMGTLDSGSDCSNAGLDGGLEGNMDTF